MSGSQATTDGDLAQVLASAVDRRRNFAIISHPDAGKTTLTEKSLLYGGATVSYTHLTLPTILLV